MYVCVLVHCTCDCLVNQLARKVQELFLQPAPGADVRSAGYAMVPSADVTAKVLLALIADSAVPDIRPVLAFFDSAFDAKLAESTGSIIPKKVRQRVMALLGLHCVHPLCVCLCVELVVSVCACVPMLGVSAASR